MSHTTTLKGVVIRDISALTSAVNDLRAKGVNCELVQKAKPRMYYQNQHGECDYVLRLKDGAYDVGFDKQSDGSYAPVFDEWSTHVSDQLRAACTVPSTKEEKAMWAIGQLMQGYAKHAAVNAAVAQGYMVESTTTDKEGNIHLILAA